MAGYPWSFSRPSALFGFRSKWQQWWFCCHHLQGSRVARQRAHHLLAENLSTKSGTPPIFTKEIIQGAPSCGEIILSSKSLHKYVSLRLVDAISIKPIVEKSPGLFQSSPASLTTKNASFTSQSKSKFWFSKDGSGYSLLSPFPSEYESPSGSNCACYTGGGGGTLSHFFPASDSSKFNSRLSSSAKIIQALVISKDQGTHVQLQPAMEGSPNNKGVQSMVLEKLFLSIFWDRQKELPWLTWLRSHVQDCQTN